MQGTIVASTFNGNYGEENVNMMKKMDLEQQARTFIEDVLKKMFDGENMTPVAFSGKNNSWDSRLLHKAYQLASEYGICCMMKLSGDFDYAYEFWYSYK